MVFTGIEAIITIGSIDLHGADFTQKAGAYLIKNL